MAYQTPLRGALIAESMLLVFLMLTRYSTLTIKNIIGPGFIVFLLIANISVLYTISTKPEWRTLERYMLYSFVLTNIFIVTYLLSMFNVLVLTAGIGSLAIAIVGALLASKKEEPIVDTSAKELYTKDTGWQPEELKVNIEPEEAKLEEEKPKKRPRKKRVFYATKTGKMVHREKCPLIKNSKKKNLITFPSKKGAKKKGYKECKRCLKK